MTAATPAASRLTLGPLLYNWPAEQRRDFYFRIADEAPLDSVYLGEVVCSKRAPFFDPHLPEVAERLTRAGKEVVFSTLALIMDRQEMAAARALAEMPDVLVEANDISIAMLRAPQPHVIGPFVNVYNEATLAYLAARGARRIVLSHELSAPALELLAAGAGTTELEVQVFGRLPLAISARCYHARSHHLHKDGCLYVCGEDANGLELDTLDGEAFLAVNGTQTQSYRVHCLITELGRLQALGIGAFRLWPQAVDMVAVAELYRDVLDRRQDPVAAKAALGALVDFAPFADGSFHGREGAVEVAPVS
jgi:collagenase-like PrtC family protease